MSSSLWLHPLTTFAGGLLFGAVGLGVVLNSCAAPNRTAADVDAYRHQLAKGGARASQADIDRFTTFLKQIGSADSVRTNTAKVYASDAWLNDTLVTKHGAGEIEAYFLKTCESMKSCQVTIDDVSESGGNYYVRWTMIVSADALSHGEPVHSIGITQVRFDETGKVVLHQDFWDSGSAFFGRLPVSGGAIGIIRKRLE